MREKLKAVRRAAGMTQQDMADRLGINLRYYKAIESGERLGSIDLWDAMENITGIHQRVLRENDPAQEDSRRKCPAHQPE